MVASIQGYIFGQYEGLLTHEGWAAVPTERAQGVEVPSAWHIVSSAAAKMRIPLERGIGDGERTTVIRVIVSGEARFYRKDGAASTPEFRRISLPPGPRPDVRRVVLKAERGFWTFESEGL